MAIDWDKLKDTADEASKDFMDIIKPYLPALARQGPDVFEGFIKHMNDRDWAKVDELMYERMTIEERRELDAEVIKGLRAAATARFERNALYKEVAFKVLLRLALAGI